MSEDQVTCQVRQFAIEMAIRIKSMQDFKMPMLIDMNKVPTQQSGINVSDWIKIMQDQKIALIMNNENPIANLDETQEIINNAEKISKYIFNGTIGN